MQQYVIETKQLTRKYGKDTVVQSVDLRVPKGGIYGFLGPNGAGKTTTIRMLLGLIRPTSGEIAIFERPLKQNRMLILRKIGSLVESPSYYGHLSGAENLEITRRLLGVPKQRIDDVLKLVRLQSAANKKVKDYSLGMKQRLGIANALLGKPELLILDEPTNGLDPAGIQEIRQLIKEMPERYGITVLISSHLLSEIEQIATHVGIIEKGRLIFQDRIEVLRSRSQNRLTIGVNQPHEAIQYLRSKGWIGQVQNNELLLSETDPKKIANINRQLVLGGFDVYRLESRQSSLEDMFLSLTTKEASL